MVNAQQKSEAGTKKRVQKTVAEQLAEAQARVEAIKAKAHAKDTKLIKELDEKRVKLVTKISELTDQVEKIDAQVEEAKANIAGPITDGVGDVPEGDDA